jgi:hypothetical protein
MVISRILELLEPALLGAVIAFFLGFLTSRFGSRRLPLAYSVAVLGFPRSGKTTLITAMFGELFANKILGYSVFPRGQSTIERVNSDLERLELGRSLEPTTDQDLFAYRADVVRKEFLLPRTYKVEVGDFPGEDSIAFTEAFGDWFHQTPYFRWAMEADAFIFVVDLERVVDSSSSREYVARISKAIRAAWQRLQENHIQGERPLFTKPVSLVFMKADLLGLDAADISDGHHDLRDGNRTRSGAGSFGRVEIDMQALKSGEEYVLKVFEELIDYLKSQAKSFDALFVSAFNYSAGRRLGIQALLRFILPTPGRARTKKIHDSKNASND